MKQVEKIEINNSYFLVNVENNVFDTPLFIGNIIYLAKIVRALSSNKIVFFAFLQIVNNSIATKLCVKLIYNCNIFLNLKLAHDTIQ